MYTRRMHCNTYFTTDELNMANQLIKALLINHQVIAFYILYVIVSKLILGQFEKYV